MPLPSPLAFLSSLFHPAISSPETKPILLTLHCLFPTDLLAALDVLDRRLITRFHPHPRPRRREDEDRGREEEGRPRGEKGGEGEEDEKDVGGEEEEKDVGGEKGEHAGGVYYVRSSRRARTTTGGESYEVRVRAWNCSCPAFAFAAFGGLRDGEDEDEEDGVGEGGFGGLGLRRGEAPVCKHLLACLLLELGAGLGDFVDHRVVRREEIAGWAAGWGG